MFRLDSAANTIGITEVGEVEVVPAALVERFGHPASGDDYKVSGEYVFTGTRDEVFVLHDWKATSQWEDDLPSPAELWASPQLWEFSISSRDLDPAEFRAWLITQLPVGMAKP